MAALLGCPDQLGPGQGNERNGAQPDRRRRQAIVLDVTVQDDFMGAVIGDLNSRRGKVMGMDPRSGEQVVKAQVPMAEFLTYAPDLRSMTGGRGIYTMEFSHYDEVPIHFAEKIIEEKKKEDAR